MWHRVAVKARYGDGPAHYFAGLASNDDNRVFEMSPVTACPSWLDDLDCDLSTLEYVDAVTCPDCIRAGREAGLASAFRGESVSA